MRNAEKQVEVSLWNCVMAIRYGMGRMTYAADDAVGLAERYWGEFDPETRKQLIDDWDFILALRKGEPAAASNNVARRWEALRGLVDGVR